MEKLYSIKDAIQNYSLFCKKKSLQSADFFVFHTTAFVTKLAARNNVIKPLVANFFLPKTDRENVNLSGM